MLLSLLLTCLLPASTASASPLKLETQPRNSASQCTDKCVRKEWSALKHAERLDYINAVKCLKRLPPNGDIPGAQNLYDDFAGVHIDKTMTVHLTGFFLTWHRHFVWLFEQAMKEKCGYSGAIPYWNWPKYANSDLATSTIFDGSETSLSGNGEFLATDDPNYNYPNGGTPEFPRGSGGGCVKTGPFANTTISFQHFDEDLAFQIAAGNATVPADALEYRPSCFKRDLNNGVASTYLTQAALDTLLSTPNIQNFTNTIEGFLDGSTTNGLHSAGHYAVGPVLFDFFASPQDPVFWLHHSMVDLVYMKWQEQDPEIREKSLFGAKTLLNTPPSENVTLDDFMEFGSLGENRRVGDVMVVGKNGYCYEYEY